MGSNWSMLVNSFTDETCYILTEEKNEANYKKTNKIQNVLVNPLDRNNPSDFSKEMPIASIYENMGVVSVEKRTVETIHDKISCSEVSPPVVDVNQMLFKREYPKGQADSSNSNDTAYSTSAIVVFQRSLNVFHGHTAKMVETYRDERFGKTYDTPYMITSLMVEEEKYQNKSGQYLWIVLSYFKCLAEDYRCAVKSMFTEEKKMKPPNQVILGNMITFQASITMFIQNICTAINAIPNTKYKYPLRYDKNKIKRATDAYLKSLGNQGRSKACPLSTQGRCSECLIALAGLKQLLSSVEDLQRAIQWLKRHGPH